MVKRIKILISIFVFVELVFVKPVLATVSSPNITVLESLKLSKLGFNDWPRANVEITPTFLGTKNRGGWYVFIVSQADSFWCGFKENLFELDTMKEISDTYVCKELTRPLLNVNNVDEAFTLPLWKRDYYGIFSGNLIDLNNGKTKLYTIHHGESLNHEGKVNHHKLPECVQAPDIGYGLLPCTPAYKWGSYNGWVSMSSMLWSKENLKDLPLIDHGPIVWPANGYVESLDGGKTWIKATNGGIRHPMSFVDNGYFYVYYQDGSQGKESEGRGTGTKVARAVIGDDGIDPNSFYNYYNGSWNEKSLPEGFSVDNYRAVLKKKGGRSSTIFPDAPVKLVDPAPGTGRVGKRQTNEFVSFSVSKISGTDYYLGVGLELTKGATLRLSKDLVNWSDPYVIPGTEMNYWNGGVNLQEIPLLYPKLANKNGDTNNVIDASEFFVIGTETGSRNGVRQRVVNTIKLSLTLPNSTSNPSDLNKDGVVDIFDYNILIAGYGTLYDIFDYNKLVSNYGK